MYGIKNPIVGSKVYTFIILWCYGKASKGSYYVINDFGLPPMLDLAPCCESFMKKSTKEQGHIKVQLGLV
jgi:hypothetical protein